MCQIEIRFIVFMVRLLKLKTASLAVVMGLMLVGCGQKGALYLNEEANRNTDFLFYKTAEVQHDSKEVDNQNRSDSNTSKSLPIVDDKILDLSDPNNY